MQRCIQRAVRARASSGFRQVFDRLHGPSERLNPTDGEAVLKQDAFRILPQKLRGLIIGV